MQKLLSFVVRTYDLGKLKVLSPSIPEESWGMSIRNTPWSPYSPLIVQYHVQLPKDCLVMCSSRPTYKRRQFNSHKRNFYMCVNQSYRHLNIFVISTVNYNSSSYSMRVKYILMLFLTPSNL